MSSDEDSLLKAHRRTPLAVSADMPVRLELGREAIERILPYRDPFLFVDRLTGLNPEEMILAGDYLISPDLPLFAGHFPDYPVYPGSLQVEAIGQLGLGLVHFISNDTTEIGSDARPPNIRATRICGAYYRGEVLPGATMEIVAKVVSHDAYFGTVLGQTLVSGKVATAALLEVTFLD